MTATTPEAGAEPHGQSLDPKVPEQATPEVIEAVQAAEAAPDKRTLYIKRCGYGNMKFLQGDATGEPAYYVEVARKLVGWDITIRRGDKTGDPILHLRKAVRFLSLIGWDKGSKMEIKDKKDAGSSHSSSAEPTSGQEPVPQTAHKTAPSGDSTSEPESFVAEGEDDSCHEEGSGAPEELNPSYSMGGDSDKAALNEAESAQLSNELTQSMKQLKLDAAEAAPVVLQRKHAFRSNRNVFEYQGATYAWDYRIAIGACHTLTNLDTKEIVAVCKLKPKVTTQSITAWGLRQNGELEIMGSGLQMQDTIVATLIGMLEWRKHNNKVWIILLAALPV